jgi:hypothetical protein
LKSDIASADLEISKSLGLRLGDRRPPDGTNDQLELEAVEIVSEVVVQQFCSRCEKRCGSPKSQC